MTARRTLAALALIASLACALPGAARTWEEVYPLQAQRTFTIADDGVTVWVTPAPPYDDEAEDTQESFRDSYEDATIVVQFPGAAPYHVPHDPYRSSPYGIRVGIGRMAPGDAAPTVLIAGYSGGAHCCATLQAVSLVDGVPVSALLPMKDGEPLDAFPRDLDGDGSREFRWIDGSLLYTFTSYASSWSVPRIYRLRRGEPVDVSREPGFAKLYRDYGKRALKACREGESESAGACAAYAYTMAVLGRPEEGIRTAAELAGEPSWYPIDCTVEWVDDGCPEGKERTFTGFEDALRWLMREHGYLP
ncbi:MAG TPA: hypothetical protein VEB68_08670 [Croceibacterium sp.]|nr:hypothetical protein [Croceibacterium sp.]